MKYLIVFFLLFSSNAFALSQGFTCTDENGHTKPCNYDQVIPDDSEPR
jgi:hypothetical protein